jgi:hypothetical protein
MGTLMSSTERGTTVYATPTTLDFIHRRYPNALSTSDTVDRFLALMQRRLAIAPGQIMLADSICSDDLNAIEYPEEAHQMLGPFKMGGLDGFPFAGLTGMRAFAHHVPEDGAVFLFHGPHIGLGKDGTTGAVLRPGQHHRSACCGALCAAADKVLRGEVASGALTELDYQQNIIEQLLLPHRDRLAAARCAVAEGTEVMYSAIEERIDLLVSQTSFPCRNVIVMGGIVINADHDIGSFCSFRRLQCIDVVTGQREDWLPDLLQ